MEICGSYASYRQLYIYYDGLCEDQFEHTKSMTQYLYLHYTQMSWVKETTNNKCIDLIFSLPIAISKYNKSIGLGHTKKWHSLWDLLKYLL